MRNLPDAMPTPHPPSTCRHGRRRSRRGGAWLVAVALALACPTLSTPQRASAASISRKAVAEAEALSKAAVERFKAGEFDAAAELFMRAYELARKPTSVFNAARAKQDAGKLAEAKALYELYGRISESPDGVVDARKRVEAIDAELAARRAAEEERAQRARLDAAAAEERALAAKRNAEEQTARAREAEERLRQSEQDAKERANAASAASAFAVAVLPPRADGADAAGFAALQRLVATNVAEAAAAGLGPVRTPAELQAAIAAHSGAAGCDHTCELATAAKLGVGWAVTWTAWQDPQGGHVRGVLWRLGRDGAGVEAAAIEAANKQIAGAVERIAGWQVAGLFDPARRLLWSPGGSPAADQGQAALLRVESMPSGATLFVDEQPAGQTPRSMRLQPGVHRLRVTLQGHADRAGSITLAPGSAGRTTITLAPIPRPAPEPPPQHTPRQTPQLPPQATPQTTPQTTPPSTSTPLQPREPGQPATTHPTAPTTPDPEQRAEPAPRALPSPAAAGGDDRMPPRLPPGRARQQASERSVGGLSEPDQEADVTGGFYLYAQGGGLGYDAGDLGFDASVGLFGHIGYGPANGVPWAALLFGVERREEANEPKGRESWGALGVWGGLALPRAAGLIISVHHQTYDVVAGPLGELSNTTLGVRKLFGGQRAYIAFGAETLISSTRTDVNDSFGPGPRFRMLLEVGIGGYGRGLVR